MPIMTAFAYSESTWETAAGCEICTGLTMIVTKGCQWCHSGVCIVGFGSITRPLLVFLLLVERVIADCLDMPLLPFLLYIYIYIYMEVYMCICI